MWTDPKTWVAYQKLTAVELNAHLRDNTIFLKENVAFGDAGLLTIDEAGVVTAAQSYHCIDTYESAAEDDLETIGGVSEGDILILRAFHADRTVVLKDGIGNLSLGTDIYLDSVSRFVVLVCDKAGNLQLLATSPRVLSRSGAGTIVSGATSIKIEHGLPKVPTRVLMTLTSSLGAASEIYVSDKDPDADGEKFEVTVDIDPENDVTFDWRAWIGEGN